MQVNHMSFILQNDVALIVLIILAFIVLKKFKIISRLIKFIIIAIIIGAIYYIMR